MASGQNKVVKLYGPWKGVADADSEGNPSTFEIGYNVHSDGGNLTARGGRVPWSWLAGVGPVPIPPYACTVGGVDYWRQLSDGDPDTYATGTLDASTVYVEITSKVKLSGIRVGIKTANSGAVTLVPKYNSDAVGTMTNLSGVSDGTLAGGKTMAQSGNVTWTVPGSWPAMNDGTYRVRLFVSGAGYSAGTQIGSLTCIPAVNPGNRRLHHSEGGGVLHTGDGVAWLDFGQRVVGLLTDAELTNGGIGKSVRIGRYGYCLDDLGRIVVLDEYEYKAKLLTAVPGSDAATQAYQTALPAFEYIAAYNDRLFGITYSGTVLFSSVENSYFIPTNGTAPYGGVHLWPSPNNFDIGPSFAGYGAETSGGYLYLFSSSRVYYYDENSRQQVPAGGGCLAPESVTSTPKGLVYVAPDGVRALSGAT
jgi:hypothetical protein